MRAANSYNNIVHRPTLNKPSMYVLSNAPGSKILDEACEIEEVVLRVKLCGNKVNIRLFDECFSFSEHGNLGKKHYLSIV